MPKPDHWIRERGGQMIHPFVDRKIRRAPNGRPVLSYGLSSYGYDLRLSDHDFRVFRHIPGHVVDPKAFDDRCLTQAELHTDPAGQFFMLPAHTYGLGVTVERLCIPANVTVVFIGKSTYARSGIIINTTPGEAGWEGNLTLEISNSSDSDCRIYANEGICQALFYEGEPCDQPYGDGKYQGQGSGVTLARV
jgi:dCTP deaminase